MPHKGSYFSACLASYVVLLNNENKVFLLRRINTEWQSGIYNVPAGKVERHETFLETAVREAKEEAGVDIRPDDLELFLIQNRFGGEHEKQPDWVDIYFVTRKWSGTPTIAEPHKADHAGWYAVDDKSIEIVPNIRDALTYLSAKKPTFVAFHAESYAAQQKGAA